MDGLQFETLTRMDGTVVLSLIGSADLAAAAALDRQLTIQCAQRPTHLVFDLSQLTFISSLCLGALVGFARGCKGWHGRTTIAAAPPTVAQMFRHARIDALIPMVGTVDEAMATPAKV